MLDTPRPAWEPGTDTAERIRALRHANEAFVTGADVRPSGLFPHRSQTGRGYKGSEIGRETHKMMLDHYQQTKNLLVSYSPKKLGFF